MATGGQKGVGWNLVAVRNFTLENTDKSRYFGISSIVVCQDNIIITGLNAWKVWIHQLRDGKCLATSDQLESRPRAMCLMDAMEICVLHEDGLVKFMSIDSTDTSRVLKATRTLRLQGVLDEYHGVVRFKDKLVISGKKEHTIYWCVVALKDGHVNTPHQIGKGSRCYVTTKDNIFYISCWNGGESPDTGIYGFDILNPSQCKYTYKHKRLQLPRGIVTNEDGNIFVCNEAPNSDIYQLTASCQLVAIFTQGIPGDLQFMFWDKGRLYATFEWGRDITVFHPVYQVGSHKDSQEQGNVDKGQLSVETEMPRSVLFPGYSEDQQGPVIPVEILRIDDKSLQQYKKALRNGKEKMYNIRVMVVGEFGVGKTTLTKRLLRKQVHMSKSESTHGIDVYEHCCKISLKTGEWIIQDEDSDQLSRLQRLMKLFSGPDQKSDVSQEQEGHGEDVYESETTSKVDNTQMSEAASSSRSDQKDQLTSKHQNVIKMSGGSFAPDYIEQNKRSFTVTKSEAESSNKEKKDAVIEILHLINKNADKLEKDTVKYAVLSIWDFAGQCAFYTTHQTFLSSRALYILVIDLSKKVTEVCDLVEIWMNSIHTCAPTPKANIPCVILVGTHVDKLDKLSEKSRKEVLVKYFKELRYILKDKPTICHLMDDIFIDNTHSDPMLETLKRRIVELASQQPNWGEERPARWLFLEQAIMTLKASGAKIVAHSLIEEINMSGSVMIENSGELDLFFRFHHEMGTILYFSVEGLRETIVLDPQWLIDAVTSLITTNTFIEKNSAITSKWNEFEETGKLTHELIDAIWTEKDKQAFIDNKSHILLIMEKLYIIARPRSFTEDGKVKEDTYFLAPCMLKRTAPLEVIHPKPNDQMGSSSVLCFVFMEKIMPSPIFHRLIGACVAHWPIATKNKEDKQENQIFCGCCVFQLDQYHKLTLHFREYVIFVRVTRMGIGEKTPSSKLCIEVREYITTILIEIIGYLGQGLKFEQFIQCPEYSGESVNSLIPVSLLKENVEVRCDFHDNKMESCKLLTCWFHDEEQSGDTDASKGHEAPEVLGDEDRKQHVTTETSVKIKQETKIQERAEENLLQAGIDMSKNELDLFVIFQQEIGTTLFFSADQQSLIDDAQKSLDTTEAFLQKNRPDIIDKWLEYRDQGKLTRELIDVIYAKERNPELYKKKDDFLDKMEKLNIIARARYFNESGVKEDNYFFTPCVLRKKSPREVITPEKDPRMVSTSVLCWVITATVSQSAIFQKLCAACLARWPVAKKKKAKMEEASKNLIFQNCTVFDLDPVHRLFLHYENNSVFARITRMGIDHVINTKSCTRVRKFITMNLSHQDPNLKYMLCVQNPESQDIPEDTMSRLSPPFEMWFMDEVHDPDAPITREHMNHARLCVALVTVCGNAMRSILQASAPVPHTNIDQAILANKTKLINRTHNGSGEWQDALLNEDQCNMLFPDQKRRVMAKIDQFDILLLYSLIRHVSKVNPPVWGWGVAPQDSPRDKSLAANVERIHLYRNEICDHSVDGLISQDEFDVYWNKIDLVLRDIDAVIGGQAFSQELEKQKRLVISVYEAC